MKVIVLSEAEAYAMAEAITYKAQFTTEPAKKERLNNVIDALTDEKAVKHYETLLALLEKSKAYDGESWLAELKGRESIDKQ